MLQREVFLLLLSEMLPLTYLEDYVHLFLTCNIALESRVVFQLHMVGFWVLEHDVWVEDKCIHTMSQQEELRAVDMDRMCLSCGFRKAVSWLGFDECAACFDEH